MLSLVGGLWWLWLYALSLVVFALLMVLNAPVYRFFYRQRGLWFMLRVIPWHLFYYLYGGTAFAIGLVRHWVSKPNSATKPASLLSS